MFSTPTVAPYKIKHPKNKDFQRGYGVFLLNRSKLLVRIYFLTPKVTKIRHRG